MIDPIVLKGFRDSLPKEEAAKKKIERKLEDVFSSHGFVPIDTPALEYSDVLLGKGGGETDKQIFRFKDNGGRDVAMRFDLTVPFARFLATHLSELPLPFKRYHINKVWRGENPQKGRYREFIQCDFDIVGADTAEADFEILSIMVESLKSLGIDDFTVSVSHRGLFSYFLDKIGVSEHRIEILRTVDKLRKVGAENVRAQLAEITGKCEYSDSIIDFLKIGEGKTFDDSLYEIETFLGKNEYSERLGKIRSYLFDTGISDYFKIDLSITRGLDYYTGIVFETFLEGIPEIGSICSGGRYNNLASLYTKENLPGVGSSIGLDRLIAALGETGNMDTIPSADVLVVPEEGNIGRAVMCACELRKKGIRADFYSVPGAKMKKIYSYVESLSVPYVITFSEDGILLKNVSTRETIKADLPEIIRLLGA